MHVAVLATLAALALNASDERTSRAREEVESQLAKELAAVPAPAMTIRFAPSAGRGYALEAARFELDGKGLDVPSVDALKKATGAETVFHGNVSPGSHELTIRLQYAGDFGLLSYMTGYKFKLLQKVSFDSRRGLEIGLDVAPKLDENKDWQHRLSVGVSRSDKMLAEIDATEPAPLPRPKLAVAEVPPPPPPPPTEVATAEEPKNAPVEPVVAAEPKGKKTRPVKVASSTAVAKEPEPAPQPAPVAAVEEKKPEPPPAPAITTVAAALMPAPPVLAVAQVPVETPQGAGNQWYVVALAAGLLLLGGVALVVWRRRGARA